MITYLKGVVQEIGDLYVILDINNVGFFVNTSNITNMKFNNGDEVKLLTELVIRENSWQIYGFINEMERSLFNLLNKVQGVGAKVALSILSAVKYDILGDTIKSKNIDLLCTADGIGEKLASRIVNELHKKIPPDLLLGNTENVHLCKNKEENLIQKDVISALLNLGFKQYEIKKALDNVVFDDNSDFESMLKLMLNQLRN